MAKAKCIIVALLLSASTMVLALEEDKEGEKLSDSEVAQLLIRQSVSQYSGRCPCPYNRASNGSRCGKRSAYSRPGGASPLCYEHDVSEEMIKRWRHNNP